jgi:hypothetical protein
MHKIANNTVIAINLSATILKFMFHCNPVEFITDGFIFVPVCQDRVKEYYDGTGTNPVGVDDCVVSTVMDGVLWTVFQHHQSLIFRKLQL